MHVPCKCYSNCAIASSALPIIMALYKRQKLGGGPITRQESPHLFHFVLKFPPIVFTKVLETALRLQEPTSADGKIYGVFYIISHSVGHSRMC